MNNLTHHTPETAPEESRELMETARSLFGMVPNLIAVMSESPALTDAYLSLTRILNERARLSPQEQQVVLLTVSVYHECHYCVAAHSVLADMAHVPGPITDALRKDQPLPDERLDALRRLTLTVVQERGWVSDETLTAFYEAGFERAHVGDVLAAIALKTMSNYINHIAGTELDAAFAGRAWSPQRAA